MELSIVALIWRWKVKHGLFSNYLFQGAQDDSGWRNLRISINFYKNNVFQLLHEIKKIFIKASCNRKSFLQLLLLKVWESFLFRESKKTCSILGLYDSSVDFKRKTKWKLIIRIWLVFLYVDSKFDVPMCK